MKWLSYVLTGAAGIAIGALLAVWFWKSALSGQSLVYIDQGVRFSEAKDLPRAVAAFNKAVVLDEKSFLARLALAEAYDKSGARELAIEEYHVALKLSEHDGRFPNEPERIKRKIGELRVVSPMKPN
jgi:tetratricopeptide (TPR) repeat protein